jgi:hypothetical protein
MRVTPAAASMASVFDGPWLTWLRAAEEGGTMTVSDQPVVQGPCRPAARREAVGAGRVMIRARHPPESTFVGFRTGAAARACCTASRMNDGAGPRHRCPGQRAFCGHADSKC